MRRTAITCFALALCCSGAARCAEVYKCTSAQGALAYQDRPCAKGESEQKLQLEPVRDDAGQNAPAAPTEEKPQPASAPNQPPPPPVPTMWLCVRAEDGVQYMSRDGNPQPRLVPAGVLGIGGKSLSQTYGPGGVGVSAPGVRATPIDRSARSAISGDFVAVQDRCVEASRAQTCAYLQQQYDSVHEKLKRAFKDEQAILKPQENQLSTDLDGC